MPVPVVVVESPASPVAPVEAAELAAAMAAGGVLVRVDDASPTNVGPAVTAAFAQFQPA
jgi:hypothetical protein